MKDSLSLSILECDKSCASLKASFEDSKKLGDNLIPKIRATFRDALNQLQIVDLVPNGHSLDLKKKLKTRLEKLHHSGPEKGVKEFLHPANGEFSYDNHLVGIATDGSQHFNFLLSNNDTSKTLAA